MTDTAGVCGSDVLIDESRPEFAEPSAAAAAPSKLIASLTASLSDMAKAKVHPRNLELPLSGKGKAAPVLARRKGGPLRGRTSRRQPLLFDYQAWQMLTADVARAAAAAESSTVDRE